MSNLTVIRIKKTICVLIWTFVYGVGMMKDTPKVLDGDIFHLFTITIYTAMYLYLLSFAVRGDDRYWDWPGDGSFSSQGDRAQPADARPDSDCERPS